MPALPALPLQPTRAPESPPSAPGADGTGSRSFPPTAVPPPAGPLPGPVDRVSFFDEQRRHRRSTWRASALCALAAILSGIPLSLAVTPILFFIVLGTTRLLGLVVDVPNAVWDRYRDVGEVATLALYRLDDDPATVGSTADVVKGMVIWLVPGTVAMLLLWPLVRMLFLRVGVGGVLLSLGAREPRPTDLEERQVVNIIEEMAIAAGRTPPRVMILDTGAANAAVVGSKPDTATIVVTRGMLDRLDRDETVGVLGHLIASAGNGDLRVALTIMSVYQTFGLIGAFVRAPISGQARRRLWQIVKYLFRRHKADAAEADALARILANDASELGGEDVSKLIDDNPNPPRPNWFIKLLWLIPYAAIAFIVAIAFEVERSYLMLAVGIFVAIEALVILSNIVFLLWAVRQGIAYAIFLIAMPYIFATFFPQMLLSILSFCLLGPMMALAWRTRRYLADASAVRLTRNPDGLARGLVALTAHGGIPRGAAWATPLFAVGSEAFAWQQDARMQVDERVAAVEQEVAAIRRESGGNPAKRMAAEAKLLGKAMDSGKSYAAAAMAEEAAEQSSGQHSALGGGPSSFVSFHPSLTKRLKRLRAMGATVSDPPKRSFFKRLAAQPLGWALLGLLAVLWAVLLVLVSFLVVLVTLIGLGACALLMFLVLGIFGLL